MSSKRIVCTKNVSISQSLDTGTAAADSIIFGQTFSDDIRLVVLDFESHGLSSNVYIQSATLTVTKTGGSANAFDARAVRVHPDASWTETTNYTNRPAIITTDASPNFSAGTSATGTISINVTAIVQSWVSGATQNGIQLEKVTIGTQRYQHIADRTSINKAYVDIIYAVNSAPNPPTNPIQNSIPETFYTLSWTPATDPDNNLAGYIVEKISYEGEAAYSDTVIVGTSTTSFSWNISAYYRGHRFYLRVKSYDTYGATSAWCGTGDEVTRNFIPYAPTITFPKNGTTIYNKRPRIGYKFGSDPDGHGQKATLTISGSTIDSSTALSFSQTGSSFVANSQIVGKWNADLLGNITVVAKSYDTQAPNASDAVSTSSLFTIATPLWTDPVLESGSIPIKAVHITQLRTAINNIQAYYGLTQTAWTDTLVAGETPIKAVHINQIRTAIEAIIAYINSFDASSGIHDVATPIWTDAILIPETTPVKAIHIAEIRSIIPIL